MMRNGSQLTPTGNAVSYNEAVSLRIQPVAYNRGGITLIPAGEHEFSVEWAYYGAAGKTIRIDPLLLGGDGMHASLIVREVEP